ncbi:MAG TPA: DUF2085 domain-containing protein, partial [Vicinamibacterales bacterium]
RSDADTRPTPTSGPAGERVDRTPRVYHSRRMVSPRASIRRAFVRAAAVWAAAIPAAAAASSLATPAWPVYLFTGGVFAIGSAVCHQLPERSFHIWGRQFPVCARCTGIYLATAVVGLCLMRTRGAERRGPSSRSGRLRMGAAALALNGLTLAYEWTTGVAASNAVRAAAGAALGAVVAALIVYDVD